MSDKITIYYNEGYDLINTGVSDDSLVTYLAIKSLCKKNSKTLPIHLEALYYRMYGEFIKTSHKDRYLNKIKTSLNELENNKLIKIIDENNKVYIINVEKLSMQDNREDHFINIDLDKIHAVIREKNKRIIRYLFYYLHLKEDNNFWFFLCGIKELARRCHVSVGTAEKYNKCLENNKIIFVYRYSGYKYSSTNYYINNCYGMYQDKNIIISMAKGYIDDQVKKGFVKKIIK